MGPWPSHPLGDLAKLARRPGAVVVNAAGATSGEQTTLHRANVELVERLARTCLEVGAGLVTLGSAAEYGAPVGPLAAESDEPQPTSPYGRSKLAATQTVLRHVDAGLRATVIRMFNLVGADRPGVDPISDFARAVNALPASGGAVHPYDSSLVRDLTGFGPGRPTWCWISVSTLARRRWSTCAAAVGSASTISSRPWARFAASRFVVEDTSPGGIPRVVGDPGLLFRLVGVREPQTVSELAALALGTA